MRLSDAMLLGLPEIRFTNNIWIYRDSDGICQGCLVGAALYAAGDVVSSHLAIDELQKLWPWTGDERNFEGLLCPACHELPRHIGAGLTRIGVLLSHLAGHYAKKQLTKEQIADYIRTIEPEECPERQASSVEAGLPSVELETK